MKPSLSAVILTKNAYPKIKQCLESLKGWASEIIIVDGQSSDETLDVCRHYTDKIFSRPFSGSFSEERNFGADQARSEWILQLDADEKVPDSFKTEFEEKCASSHYNCYKSLRENYFFGKAMTKGPWHHYIQILYRKNKARFVGKVHERLEVQGDIGVFNFPIEHYPFDSLSEFITKQNRYTDLYAEEWLETKGQLPWKKVRRQIYYKPFKLFYKLYFRKKAYKEGYLGFLFSALYSYEHLLRWAKYWEKIKNYPS